MTITINNNINFTGSKSTCEAIRDLVEAPAREAAARARREQAEREAYALLHEMAERKDPADWDFYSDLYKDLYGIRPHWGW